MLKFLTHKLRTHSLNEESVSEKVEERDSGTESDDEAERADTGDFCTDVIMKWNDVTDISMCGAGDGAGAAPRLLPEPDHLYDHHSSEEELEVINGLPCGPGAARAAECRRRGASSPPAAAPGKRKWPAPPYRHHDHDHEHDHDHDLRDDDDDTKVETPVRFRTSPPLEALKPRRSTGAPAGACSCGAAGGPGGAAGGPGGAAGGPGGAAGVPGGPAGVPTGPARAPASPRRRRVALVPPRRHRPALDFDKMQQLKVGGGGVRSWRAGAGGAHGGELSVFCW